MLKIPELRYKKVPKAPEEPSEIKLNIPDELNLDDIEPLIMFNEDIPDYYTELIKMGYSKDAVEMLEGIPDLDACKEFIDYYKEAVINLEGKQKALFQLKENKMKEIAVALILWDDKDDLSYLNKDQQNEIKALRDKYGKAKITDSGFKFEKKLTSIGELPMCDRIMIKNHGRNRAKMASDFIDELYS